MSVHYDCSRQSAPAIWNREILRGQVNLLCRIADNLRQLPEDEVEHFEHRLHAAWTDIGHMLASISDSRDEREGWR